MRRLSALVSSAGIKLPGWVVVAAVIALVVLALGAVLFIPQTDEGTRRLGIFLGLLSPVLLSLVVLIRANDAAVRSHSAATSAADSATSSASASSSAARIADTTDKLANGYLDAKLRAVVHDELEAHDESVHGIARGSRHGAPPAPPELPKARR